MIGEDTAENAHDKGRISLPLVIFGGQWPKDPEYYSYPGLITNGVGPDPDHHRIQSFYYVHPQPCFTVASWQTENFWRETFIKYVLPCFRRVEFHILTGS